MTTGGRVWSSLTRNQAYQGQLVTLFEHRVWTAHNEHLGIFSGPGILYRAWCNGTITKSEIQETTTNNEYLLKNFRVVENEWVPYYLAKHIRLPVESFKDCDKTYAIVTELNAYKIRNWIRLRLDEEAKYGILIRY